MTLPADYDALAYPRTLLVRFGEGSEDLRHLREAIYQLRDLLTCDRRSYLRWAFGD